MGKDRKMEKWGNKEGRGKRRRKEKSEKKKKVK
jgi:hypothetical protein